MGVLAQYGYAGTVSTLTLRGMTANGRLYQEVAGAIREQIASGGLAPGERVGSSLDVMAAQYRVSIATVRAALKILGDEGLVKTTPGKGSFVQAAGRATGPQDGQDGLRREVEALQVDVMELYAKLGYEQPSHQQDGRRRHEDAG